MSDEDEMFVLEEKPELFGSALVAYETAQACLTESLGILGELSAQGIDVNDQLAVIPPEYAERLAVLDARLKANEPEIEKIAQSKNARRSSGISKRRGVTRI
jgi:hypothetical protein